MGAMARAQASKKFSSSASNSASSSSPATRCDLATAAAASGRKPPPSLTRSPVLKLRLKLRLKDALRRLGRRCLSLSLDPAVSMLVREPSRRTAKGPGLLAAAAARGDPAPATPLPSNDLLRSMDRRWESTLGRPSTLVRGDGAAPSLVKEGCRTTPRVPG